MDITDKAFLDQEYGQDIACLTGRRGFYDRFRSTPPTWQEWLAQELLTPHTIRVLDVGCGDASLWRTARAQGSLPEGVSVLLIDGSKPMVDACKNLLSGDPRFSVLQAEAKTFLRETESVFDLILGGHVIYHIDRPEEFVCMAWEKLAPGGELVLTSVGENHLNELVTALEAFFDDSGIAPPGLTPLTFRTPDSLAILMRTCFGDVCTKAYRSGLSIDDARLLFDFLASRTDKLETTDDALARFSAQGWLLPLNTEIHNLLARGRKDV